MLESTEDIKSVPSENPQPEKIGRKFEARERTFLIRALIFSVLLHGGIFVKFIMPEEVTEAVRDKIAIAVRSLMRIAEKKAYIERLRASKEMQEDSDGFFLDSEFYEGSMSEDELGEGRGKITRVIREFQEIAGKEKDRLKVLRQLAKSQGINKHKDYSSYLSRLVLKLKGNCEARAKKMASIVKKVYPDMPIQYQIFRKHMRVIVKIEGQWYAFEEDDLIPVNQDDLKGTVLADSSIFVDTYLGKKPSVKAIDVTGNPKPIDNKSTDTYFSLLPPDLSAKLRDADVDTGEPDELKVSVYSEKEMDERLKLADKIKTDKQNEILNACIKNEKVLLRIKDLLNRRYKLMAVDKNSDKTWSLGFRYKRDDGNLEAETWIQLNEKDMSCEFDPTLLFKISR